MSTAASVFRHTNDDDSHPPRERGRRSRRNKKAAAAAAAQAQAAVTKAKARGVRFRPRAAVRLTPSRSCMSEGERGDVWYSSSDNKRIQRGILETVKTMRTAAAAAAAEEEEEEAEATRRKQSGGGDTDADAEGRRSRRRRQQQQQQRRLPRGLCTRGLEHMRTAQKTAERKLIKQRVRDAVLREQSFQVESGMCYNPTLLAEASLNVTRGSRDRAVRRARRDEEFVRCMLADEEAEAEATHRGERKGGQRKGEAWHKKSSKEGSRRRSTTSQGSGDSRTLSTSRPSSEKERRRRKRGSDEKRAAAQAAAQVECPRPEELERMLGGLALDDQLEEAPSLNSAAAAQQSATATTTSTATTTATAAAPPSATPRAAPPSASPDASSSAAGGAEDERSPIMAAEEPRSPSASLQKLLRDMVGRAMIEMEEETKKGGF